MNVSSDPTRRCWLNIGPGQHISIQRATLTASDARARGDGTAAHEHAHTGSLSSTRGSSLPMHHAAAGVKPAALAASPSARLCRPPPVRTGVLVVCGCDAPREAAPAAAAAAGPTPTGTSTTTNSTTTSSVPRQRTAARQSAAPHLPPPPDLAGSNPRARWNAVSLAFLGDAVWEVYLRSHFYGHAELTTPLQYGARVSGKASTQAQAACYTLLLEGGQLSAQEQEVLRWASNSSSVAPPKHASRQQYKQATAVEALVGVLYLTDGARLHQLMAWLLDEQRVAAAIVRQPGPDATRAVQRTRAPRSRVKGGG